MDQLLAMRVFVEVVEADSFTSAAKRLELSRTMTSKHVMDLEHHLKARLLNRTTRSLSLTSAGRVYFERAKQVLTAIDEADDEVARQSLTPHGTLRVNAPMSFGITHVAPQLTAYMERYPDVEVELTLNDRVVDLVDEGYDVAVRIGELAESSLIARRLAASRLIACAAPAYLKRHASPEHPSDLAQHVCLGYAHGDTRERWRFTRAGSEISVKVKSRLVSNNGDALMAAAISGLGVILQPAFIVNDALATGALRRILSKFDAGVLGVHAVYPHTRLLSARVRTFIDHLAVCYANETWEADVTSPT